MKLQSFAFENEIYFENQIILEFHPPTEFARDTILFIVVRSLSSEQNVIKPIKFINPNGCRIQTSVSLDIKSPVESIDQVHKGGGDSTLPD